MKNYKNSAQLAEKNNSTKNGWEINKLIKKELKEKFSKLNFDNLRVVGMNDASAEVGKENGEIYKRDLVSVLIENTKTEKHVRIVLPRNYCLDPEYFENEIQMLQDLNRANQ